MKDQELTKIAQEIASCQSCPLFKTAHQAVPGEGNPKAKIVFVGEAPGAREDQQGIPFCGAAGKLLGKLFEKINLKRKEVFITNLVKHRPPGNRHPQALEIKACAPFLKKQLLTIRPKIVVTLGRLAMNFFLPGEFISKIHGQPREIIWQNLKLIIIPLYHPAAALRSSRLLHQLTKDFLILILTLEVRS